MKLKARIGEREEDLNLKIDAGSVLAEIGDRSYELEVLRPAPNTYLLFVGTNVYEGRVSARSGSKEVIDIDIGGHTFPVTIFDPKRLRSGQNLDRHHHGAAEIRAPMPGKVVRVHVEAGVNVEKGVGLVVVEAMKMQNEMKSPRDGVVVSLNVKTGDTVNAGDVLAVVE